LDVVDNLQLIAGIEPIIPPNHQTFRYGGVRRKGIIRRYRRGSWDRSIFFLLAGRQGQAENSSQQNQRTSLDYPCSFSSHLLIISKNEAQHVYIVNQTAKGWSFRRNNTRLVKAGFDLFQGLFRLNQIAKLTVKINIVPTVSATHDPR